MYTVIAVELDRMAAMCEVDLLPLNWALRVNSSVSGALESEVEEAR